MRIRYYCYIGTNGLCIAAKEYIAALYIQGHVLDVRALNDAILPNKGISVVDDILLKCFERDIEYDLVIVHALCTRFKEVRDVEGPNMKIIGLAVWETTRLSGGYKEGIKYVNELIVPSTFNVDVFKQYTKIPIHLVHHVMNPIKCDKPLNVAQGKYMFYFIGEWCERKGIEDLIRIFDIGFKDYKDVILYIKTFMFEDVMSKSEFETFLKQYRSDRVIINTDTVTDEYIASLHVRGDCYISCARSEGVGIPICQAAMYNKPVICLDFGGQLDYIPNPYTVKSKLIDCNPCATYHKCKGSKCELYSCYTDENQKWAIHVNDKDFIDTMYMVYNTRPKINDALSIKKMFSLHAIGKKISKIIKDGEIRRLL